MSFYLVLVLILVLQSSVLVGIFESYLFVPDLLLCFLFLSSLKGQVNYGRGFLAGLLLDILQGSLGWHASGKLLALMVLDIIKGRFYINLVSTLIIAYAVVAIIEHAYRYILFRAKYYYPMDFHALLGFLIELFIVYYFGKKSLKGSDEA
ncbi:rod shape-determining protein MreD [Thermocrinis sp.]